MQQRIHTEHWLDAAGPDEHGPGKRFRLVRRESPEYRRHDGERWQIDPSHELSPCRYTTVAEFSRNELAKIIADGVDWLAYIEEGK